MNMDRRGRQWSPKNWDLHKAHRDSYKVRNPEPRWEEWLHQHRMYFAWEMPRSGGKRRWKGRDKGRGKFRDLFKLVFSQGWRDGSVVRLRVPITLRNLGFVPSFQLPVTPTSRESNALLGPLQALHSSTQAHTQIHIIKNKNKGQMW